MSCPPKIRQPARRRQPVKRRQRARRHHHGPTLPQLRKPSIDLVAQSAVVATVGGIALWAGPLAAAAPVAGAAAVAVAIHRRRKANEPAVKEEVRPAGRSREDWFAENWAWWAQTAGVPGVKLHKFSELPDGYGLVIQGKPGEVPVRKLDLERIASLCKVDPGKVLVQRYPGNPRRAIIQVIEHDVLSTLDNRHPAMIGAGKWATASRSVRDLLPFALDTEGKLAALPLWTPSWGGHAILVGGQTGAGKSNVVNSLTASALACNDTLTCLIDVAKGGVEAENWGPDAINWVAATPEEALWMLKGLLELSRWRSRPEQVAKRVAATGSSKWRPSPGDPFVELILDEGQTVLTTSDPSMEHIAHQAARVFADLMREKRSGGIGIIFATQYPIAESFGGKKVSQTQFDTGIALFMANERHVHYVLSKESPYPLNELEPGECIVRKGRNVWERPVKAFELHETADIRPIGQRYSVNRPSFGEPALEILRQFGYDKRRRPGSFAPAELPEEQDDMVGSNVWERAKAKHAQRAAAMDDVASEPDDAGEEDLIEDPQWQQPGSESIAHARILELLGDAGQAGMGPGEIGGELKMARMTAHRRLKELVEAGQITAAGATKNRRYMLPVAGGEGAG